MHSPTVVDAMVIGAQRLAPGAWRLVMGALRLVLWGSRQRRQPLRDEEVSADAQRSNPTGLTYTFAIKNRIRINCEPEQVRNPKHDAQCPLGSLYAS